MSIRTAKNLDVGMIIRTKCKEFDHLEWVGHLQPAEIMALYNAGYRPYSDHDMWKVEWAQRDVNNGIGGGSWYYFNIKPNKKGLK